MRMRRLHYVALAGVVLSLAGCGPKEGSAKWCDSMANKPRGEFTPHQQQVYQDRCASRQIQKQIDSLMKK
jgi:hypothetical protein